MYLKDLGVAILRISFDGEGDSGELNGFDCRDHEGNRIDFPHESLVGKFEDWGYDKADELVNDYGGDWVNNNGGYGWIEIDVIKKTVDGQYYQRTTDEYSWDGGNIFN